LDVVGKILQRALTLTTQAQDATLNTAQLKSIGAELVALNTEITNIGQRTKFQGGGSATAVFTAANNANVISVATGATNPTSITATLVNTDVSINEVEFDYGAATADITFNDTAAFLASNDAVALGSEHAAEIEALIAANATNRGALGAKINSLEYAVDNMQTLSTNLADGISRIVDTDYAAETSNLTRTQILQQAATSMLAQANQMPNVILTLLK
jgi:flagellin